MSDFINMEKIMRFSFTRISSNSKTGPIPTTMTSRESCPDSCGLKGNGCYAQSGMVAMHWRKLDNAGLSLKELQEKIQALPKGQLWRHNVAGDIPTYNDGTIKASYIIGLINANKGKRGFTYTHINAFNKENSFWINEANANGFTVNLSADTLEQADKLKELNIGPVVCLMPLDAPKVMQTPKGNNVIKCPATYQEYVTCSSCGICAVSTRKSIIGFPVHGSGKNKAQRVFMIGKG